MAFPFSVYNIAYPAAGFKSETQNCDDPQLVRPFFGQTEDFPISGDSAKVHRPAALSFSYQVIPFSDTHRNTPQAPIFIVTVWMVSLSGYAVKARYGADRAAIPYFGCHVP